MRHFRVNRDSGPRALGLWASTTTEQLNLTLFCGGVLVCTMKSRIRANEKAAQKPKPQAPAKSPPRFAVGQFVLPDTPERHAVVIVDVFSTEPQKRSPPDYFYLCKGSAARDVGDTYLLGAPEAPLGCSWIAEAKLRAYEVVPSAFPLLDMPMPALAHVLWFVPLHEGAQLAGLCRKLRSAFQDAVEWRRRCATELPGVDIDAQVSVERSCVCGCAQSNVCASSMHSDARAGSTSTGATCCITCGE